MFWEVKRLERSRENKRNEIWIASASYIAFQYLLTDRDVSRICQALKALIDAAIEHMSKAIGISIDRGCCRGSIKGSESFSLDRGCCREVSRLLKTSFSRKEKHRYDFNLSKSSLNKNFKNIDPKNTHTHNKSNQFYISKISQDSLVSIH